MAAKRKPRKSKDDAQVEMTSTQSGGVNVDGDVTVGGDVVGRDKTVSAGGHIVHAEPGATVIIGERPAPELEDLSPAPGDPPFKGLQYFDEADADLFFGRELLTAKLVARLSPSPDSSGEGWGGGHFLAVVGASGSGKSSVVRAGLVPALKRGEPLADGTLPPEGSTRWSIHVITPTAHPVKELAASLTRDAESVTATATLMDDLARDRRSLDLAVSRVLKQGGGGNRLLLVVDQFEELFTACKDDAERRTFVDNLLTAVETDGPTIVVITLRADFYAHCAQYDNLREALAKRQEYIGPMSADELRRAIEEPAKRGNWEFEPGLVDLLLRDVGDEPGALPLLSHALLETWKRRRGRTLTLAGYHESGGVHGAIAKTAETVFNQRLTPEQQPIARNIFLRLTELGEGTQDTRRRASFNELIPNPQLQPSVESVLKILADARLVTTAEGTAEVAHEALIREWPTLRKWLDEDREGLRIHRQLTKVAQEWVQLNRDPGALYRGARLAAAGEWAKDHAAEMNALELEFLDTSRALRVSELEAAKRRAVQLRRRARYLAGVLAAALIMGIAAGLFGIRAWRQSEIAFLRQLGAQSIARLNDRFDLALLLSLETARVADTIGDTFEGRNSLLRVLEHNPQLTTFRHGHTDAVSSVAFSPDGQTLASGSDDGSIRLWDVATRQPLGESLTGYTDAVSSVAFSPDGQTLAAGGSDRSIQLWDVATRQPLGEPLTGIEFVSSVAFSPDGKMLASGSADGSIWLWDVATRQPLGEPLTAYNNPVLSVAFSPDGKTLASGSYDGSIRLWDVATRQRLGEPLTGHTDRVWSVAFSPDGKTLASGSDDRSIRLWDVALESWKDRICDLVGRNFTQAEWAQYFGERGEPYHKTCEQWPEGE